jgi:predicted transcriptional regulator
MKKTSVYLDSEHERTLRWAAEAEGRPQAEVLREAIREHAERILRRRDRNFVMDGIAEGPGGSIADIPEEELLKGFGE